MFFVKELSLYLDDSGYNVSVVYIGKTPSRVHIRQKADNLLVDLPYSIFEFVQETQRENSGN